ncbi:radical SAM protein, partial [Nanoarchaeota archaeon]
MTYTILDCYTDEPSGLGVPPYIGTYPRYLYGAIKEKLKEIGQGNDDIYYITIDDLRLHVLFEGVVKKSMKTNTRINNLSVNYPNISKILAKTDILVVNAGVQTPGKYLSAVPGTLFEVRKVIKDLRSRKILVGPGAMAGTRLEGGKKAEKIDTSMFDQVEPNFLSINDYDKINKYGVVGAEVCKQHPDFIKNPDFIMAEIETGKGCLGGKCSFCTEPLKNKLEFREQKDVLVEVKALQKIGVNNFRLGKQSCFYSYKMGDKVEVGKLLKGISSLNPNTLHIDNANPNKVTEDITKLIVKHCTPGNIAAFGVESFDKDVIKANNLNTSPEQTFKAVEIINKYGKVIGDNGMPKFLPGINLLLGLIGEKKKSHEENMFWLQKVIDENLLLRRINIRQVTAFPGTPIYEIGNKVFRKNKKYYWKWRNEIRQKIDYPMLQKLVPKGSVLRNCRTEIYDGNTTFCRQLGTYPLIIGVKKRLPLNEFVKIKVENHMLRSLV